jgi:hypothetical protein
MISTLKNSALRANKFNNFSVLFKSESTKCRTNYLCWVRKKYRIVNGLKVITVQWNVSVSV